MVLADSVFLPFGCESLHNSCMRVDISRDQALQKLLTFVERHKLMLLDPFSFVRINLCSRSAPLFHHLQRLGQWFYVLRHAKDELVVSRINGAAEKLPALGVSPGNQEILATHHVPLEAGSHQPIDVLANGNEHLSSQVAAFLAAVKLVLEVHSRRAVFCKELCELEHC